jgi:hypothetical protein
LCFIVCDCVCVCVSVCVCVCVCVCVRMRDFSHTFTHSWQVLLSVPGSIIVV